MTRYHQRVVSALPCVASVSGCRAAGRRWGVGASFALQMSAASGTRHQTKGKAAPSRTTLERFVPSVPSAENGVGTRRAPIHAVSPLSPLSPVQMSVPRRQAACFAVWFLLTGAATPPLLGPSGGLWPEGSCRRENALVNDFFSRSIFWVTRTVTVHF